jgi:hypothetical protein
MEQPAAKISKSDIERIIIRDFTLDEKEEVYNLLNKYSVNTSAGPYRVWASLLKLSKGELVKLKNIIETAIGDYRDILAAAEYPEYLKRVGFNAEKFSRKELDQIIKADWEQYQS